MAYRVRKVKYVRLRVPARAGQAAAILHTLKEANIDLLAFSGFPVDKGKAQIDLISDDMAAIGRVARKHDWRLSKVKQAFLSQGDDQPGAIEKVLRRLADERINVIAADAVAAGKGRYGMIFWVKQNQYRKAAHALNAQ